MYGLMDSTIINSDDVNHNMTYSETYLAHYAMTLKEGELKLDGVKNRISDDNSLKNIISLQLN